MKSKYFNSILKYCSPKVLYIINTHRRLDKRICPFEVRARLDVGDLRRGDIMSVESIKVTQDLVTVFIVNHKAYYYYHFDIL
jgi:hypothetical protein